MRSARAFALSLLALGAALVPVHAPAHAPAHAKEPLLTVTGTLVSITAEHYLVRTEDKGTYYISKKSVPPREAAKLRKVDEQISISILPEAIQKVKIERKSLQK